MEKKANENRFAIVINGKVLKARIHNVLSKFPARVTAERYVGEGPVTNVSRVTVIDRKAGKSYQQVFDPPFQLEQGESLEFSERLDRIKENMKDSQTFQLHI